MRAVRSGRLAGRCSGVTAGGRTLRWAAQMCTGTGLTLPRSAPGLGSPRPHRCRDWQTLLTMIKSSVKAKAGFSMDDVKPLDVVKRCFLPGVF